MIFNNNMFKLSLVLAFAVFIFSSLSIGAENLQPFELVGRGSISGSVNLNYIMPDVTALGIYQQTDGRPASDFFNHAQVNRSTLTQSVQIKLINHLTRAQNNTNIIEDDFIVKGVVFCQRKQVNVFSAVPASGFAGNQQGHIHLWKDGINDGSSNYIMVSLNGSIGSSLKSANRNFAIGESLMLTNSDFDASSRLAYFTINGDIIDTALTTNKIPGNYIGVISVQVTQF